MRSETPLTDESQPSDTNGSRPTKVFISSSSRDTARVEQLIVRLLEKHNIPYFFAPQSISLTVDWQESIKVALKSSTHFVVVISANSVQSKWVKTEVHWALDHLELGRIIPVQLSPCDPADINLRLRGIQCLDFLGNPLIGGREFLRYFGTTPIETRSHIGAPTSARDEPASVDYLNREPWLVALATMFASPKHGTPFTLALFGDWGGGKSSLLRMLKDRLRKYAQNPQLIEFDFAEFNAWEYEKTDNIAAGLAQEVVRGIVDGYAPPVDEKLSRWRRGPLRIGRWFKRCRLAMNFAAREHGWTFYRYPFGLLAFSLIALACWYFPSIPAAMAAAVPDALKGAKGGLAALIPALIGWPIIVGGAVWMLKSLGELLEHPLSVELHTFLQLPGYKQHLGTVPVLKQQIRTLCGMRLGTQGKRQRRLVVFVDDLDRCSPECIVSTLEAVRLVMDLEHVIVMIAVDPRIALQAVGYHYRRLASKERSAQEIAREYLAKIIQLSIQLPPLEAAAMETYIEKRLFDDVLDDEPKAETVRPPRAMDRSTEGTSDDGLPVAQTLTPSPSPGRRGVDEPQPKPQETVSVEHVETQALLASLQDRAGDREAFRQAMQNRPVGFHNPRRLLRLRNAFRLLKVVAFSSKTPIEHRDLIEQLFAREQSRMDSQGGTVPSSGNPILDAMVEAVILPEILQMTDEPRVESPQD